MAMKKKLFNLAFTISVLLITSSMGEEKFVFAVIGDTRPPYGSSSFKNFDDQLQRITSFKPALLINLGDLIYGYGGQATDDAWSAYDSIIARFRLPYYQVPGNHDIFSMKAQEEYRRQFKKLYYSFDTAGCHFIMLDNTEDAQWGLIGHEQLNWLEKDLASSRSQHIFVFMHLPSWEQVCVGKEHFLIWKDRLHPLFRRSNVKAVFAGHIHAYGPTQTIDGIRYFITGGGGAELEKHYLAAGGDFHFMLVTDSKDGLDWRIVTANAVLDETGASVEKNRLFAGCQVRALLLWYEKLLTKHDQNVEVVVNNPYDSALVGKAFWADSGNMISLIPSSVDVRIAPHKNASFTFAVRADMEAYSTPTLKFDVSAGGVRHVFTKDLIIRRKYQIIKADISPIVDGSIDEWTGCDTVILKGSKDLSPVAWVQTTWNKRGLWIAAKVRHPRHPYENIRRSNPINEALIIGIDRMLSRSESGNKDLQIMVAHDSIGVELYDQAHGIQLDPALTGISAAVVNHGDTVISYEMELPATFLKPLQLRKHSRFGINFAVMTVDSSGGKRLLSWTPGIGYDGFDESFKSQAHFAEAELW